MKRYGLFLFSFVMMGQAFAAHSGFFQGAMQCSGPYDQPQLGLPPAYIQVTVTWDPLFRNSDVKVRIGSVQDTGVALLYIAQAFPPGPMDPDPEQHRLFLEGEMKMKKKNFEFWVYHGQETDYHSLIDEGRLEGYVLQCHRVQ